jgi:hypothetical protein
VQHANSDIDRTIMITAGAMPEPSTVVMLLTGLSGAVARLRRRRR